MRNPQVLVQIGKIDAILERSGIRDHCIECIHSPEGGCCQSCEFLGPNGCTNKPLSCALWTCRRVDRMFPEAVAELLEIKRKYPYPVANGYRKLSLEAERYMGEGKETWKSSYLSSDTVTALASPSSGLRKRRMSPRHSVPVESMAAL